MGSFVSGFKPKSPLNSVSNKVIVTKLKTLGTLKTLLNFSYHPITNA